MHPLFGRLLEARSFKRWEGSILLVVVLPDGTPGTIPVDATDVLGGPIMSPLTSVLSVEGVRRLRGLLEGLAPAAASSRKGTRTRK